MRENIHYLRTIPRCPRQVEGHCQFQSPFLLLKPPPNMFRQKLPRLKTSYIDIDWMRFGQRIWLLKLKKDGIMIGGL